MATGRLDGALSSLNNAIQTIDAKVIEGKAKASKYRENIIVRLGEVVNQLKKLQDLDAFKSIPRLQGQLNSTNAELKKKTDELQQVSAKINELNNTNSNLKKQIDDINTELKNKNEELRRAQEAILAEQSKTAQKDKAIQDLSKQVKDLNEAKNNAERALSTAQAEISSLVDKIARINHELVGKIALIDTITQDLNIDDAGVSNGFKLVADNIQAIMNMINSPTSARPLTTSKYPLYNQFISKPQNIQLQIADTIGLNSNTGNKEFINQIGLKRDTSSEITEDEKARVDTLLQNYGNPDLLRGGKLQGGKRRRRTMKRYGKKNKSYRGGYVYSSSKELDKASSVISSSSNSNSLSDSNSDSKSKKKRSTKKRKSIK